MCFTIQSSLIHPSVPYDGVHTRSHDTYIVNTSFVCVCMFVCVCVRVCVGIGGWQQT